MKACGHILFLAFDLLFPRICLLLTLAQALWVISCLLLEMSLEHMILALLSSHC